MNLIEAAKDCRRAAERNLAGASVILDILHFMGVGS
jgi:hypothetical protein